MQVSLDDSSTWLDSISYSLEINFLVLKHLEQYADKLPSLEKLKREIVICIFCKLFSKEHLHLLGESLDLDSNVQPITYDYINSTYRDISSHQLSTLIEEGVDHIKLDSNNTEKIIDILKPVIPVRIPFFRHS